MLKFILKRSLYGIVVMFLVVIIVSSIIFYAPVDPVLMSGGDKIDAETVEKIRMEYGLDASLFTQLRLYLKDVSPISLMDWDSKTKEKYQIIAAIPLGSKALTLKWPYLRESYQTRRPVTEVLKEAIPLTAILALSAILLAAIIGISLGVLSAIKQNTFFDHFAVVTSVMGYSLPSYVTAMILALVFGYYLFDYTGLNVQGSLIVLNDVGEEVYVWKNLILPAIALGIRPVAIITQLTRSAMLDVLKQDYIRTAKAKGLSYYKVITKHALRNALNPVVTAISGWFAALLAGAFFVEKVFNFRGLGDVTVQALLVYDIPLIQGAILFTAFVFVVLNILVDIMYAFLDPRVSVA